LDKKPHFYQLVAPGLGRKLFIEKLIQQNSVCFDLETTSLNTLDAEIVGIAFSWETGKGYYVPLPENQQEAQSIMEEFRVFFENEKIEKVRQNLKYDIKVLKNYQVEVLGEVFDTMLAHYIINPDMRHNMDVLAETYLNYSPMPIEKLIGKKGKSQKSM